MKAGQPILEVLRVTSTPTVRQYGHGGGHITLSNRSINTVWISWDGDTWVEVSVGTSYECDQEVRFLHLMTQTGVSTMYVNWIPWV